MRFLKTHIAPLCDRIVIGLFELDLWAYSEMHSQPPMCAVVFLLYTTLIWSNSASFVWLCGFFQDNNGVIGLVEPLKTSKVPVKLPMIEPVVKIASGKTTVFSVVLCCRVFPLLKSASLSNRQRPHCDGHAGGTSLHRGHRRAGAAGEGRWSLFKPRRQTRPW